MFEKRKNEIKAERAKLRDELKAGNVTAERMDEIEARLDQLDTEEAMIQRQQDAVDRLNRGGGQVGGHGDRGDGDGDGDPTPIPGPANPITGRGGVRGEVAGGGLPSGVDSRAAHLADIQGVGVSEVEERAAAFQRGGTMRITTDAVMRSLTLASGNIAQPTRVSGINPGQNVVSGIVDMVRVVDADGMGEDAVAYGVGTDGQTAGSKKDDGKATKESGTEPKVARIVPVLLTTLSYVSRNIQRTTPLNYQSRVSENALNALRQKTGVQIVMGSGKADATDPEIMGIFSAAAIDAGTDLEIDKIDHTTLRKIALKYGGAANVEGGGVLLLNKEDLIAFGDVRGEKEKKAVYEIEFSENSTTTGTIKDGGLSVRFCIVDALPVLTDAETAADTYCMAYGKPLAYQLDLFGPYEVEVSRDYKFAEGLLAVMGTAMVGGNVVSENGFIRVKKSATASGQ